MPTWDDTNYFSGQILYNLICRVFVEMFVFGAYLPWCNGKTNDKSSKANRDIVHVLVKLSIRGLKLLSIKGMHNLTRFRLLIFLRVIRPHPEHRKSPIMGRDYLFYFL